MVDWISIGIAVAISAGVSIPAYLFAFLTWRESQKQSRLLATITETLPLIVKKRKPRPRRKPEVAPVSTTALVTSPPKPPSRTTILQDQAAERARLRLQLQKEKQDWQQQKDMATAIGWIIDRLGSSDDEDEYEDEEP